jgi:hypothetical protein
VNEKLSAKILNIFAGGGRAVVRNLDVAVVLVPGVACDDQLAERNRAEFERKRFELGERFAFDETKHVRRLDGRDADYKPSLRAA